MPFNNEAGLACKTTGASNFVVFTRFSMFLHNYAIFCDFKSAVLATHLGQSP